MAKMTEKNVVLEYSQKQVPALKKDDTNVPTRIHSVWLIRNQVTNAEISSALNLRNDLIVNHLKRMRKRCQKLVATFKRSSLVGRCA
jgi:hypothetical protein